LEPNKRSNKEKEKRGPDVNRSENRTSKELSSIKQGVDQGVIRDGTV